MLISLQFSNFLSFRDETTFSMVASREKQHGERLQPALPQGFTPLPVAAIFGGNGSGKSNFYRALKLAQYLVAFQKENAEASTGAEAFLLDHATPLQPSRFTFELLIDGQAFRYSFAVSRHRVWEESLQLLGKKKAQTVFSRTAQGEDSAWNLKHFAKLGLAKDEVAFLRFKTRDTLPNQLFLNALRGKKIPLAEAVIRWFQQTLVLVNPQTTFRMLALAGKNGEGLRAYCGEALKNAHTGIDAIDGEEVSFDAIDAPEDLKARVKETIAGDKACEFSSPSKKRYVAFSENGRLECRKLVAVHRPPGGAPIRFEIADESEGTQRLLDLLPAFYELASAPSPKVFVIDELDRSLHTLLTRNLIESYLASRTRHPQSQLLFTTHDSMLLDQSVFRRDELWFVDKDANGASSLSALSDFKEVRYDKDIRKSYLLGRFGGVPALDRFESLKVAEEAALP